MALDPLIVKILGDDSMLRAVFARARGQTGIFARGASADILRVGQSFQKAALLGQSSLARLGIPLTASTAGMVYFVKRMVDAADQLQATADATGITAEALQELQYVGSQLGVQIDGDLTKALQKMIRTLGDAEGGSKSALKGFADLGLRLADLKGKAPLDVFSTIADRLSKIEDPARRAAIGAELFGKGWAAIAPMLMAGGKAIDDLRAKARAMGLVVSNDMVAKAAEASDQFDTLGAVFRTAGINLAAQFLGPMKTLAGIMTSKEFQAGVKSFATDIGAAITWISNNVETVQRFALAFLAMRAGAAFGPWGAAAGAAAGFFSPEIFKRIEEGATGAVDQVEALRRQIEGIDKQIEDIKSGAGVLFDLDPGATAIANNQKINDLLAQRKNLAAQLRIAYRDATANHKDADLLPQGGGTPPPPDTGGDAYDPGAEDKWARSVLQIKQRTEELKVEAATVGKSTFEIEKRKAALELENELTQAGLTLTPERASQIDQLSTLYAENVVQLNKVREAQERVDQAAMDSFDAMKTGFKDLISGGKSFGEVLSDLAAKFADMLADSAFDALFKPSVGGSDGGVFGGIFKAIGSLFGFADGGIMTDRGKMPLRTYSTGGIANTPQLAMFGEGRRPEAYVPLPDGHSIPVTLDGLAAGAGAVGGGILNFSPVTTIDARNADVGLASRLPALLDSNNKRLLSLVERMLGDHRIRFT